jgi:hypothetical protein
MSGLGAGVMMGHHIMPPMGPGSGGPPPAAPPGMVPPPGGSVPGATGPPGQLLGPASAQPAATAASPPVTRLCMAPAGDEVAGGSMEKGDRWQYACVLRGREALQTAFSRIRLLVISQQRFVLPCHSLQHLHAFARSLSVGRFCCRYEVAWCGTVPC